MTTAIRNRFPGVYARNLHEIEVLSPRDQHRLLVHVVRAREARHALDSVATDASGRRFLEAQVRTGDRAVERLTLANLRLVIWTVDGYTARHAVKLDREDLIQEGVFGLRRAIEKFDPSRGTALTTYAMRWIQQAIQRAEAQAGLVRIPVHTQSGDCSRALRSAAARFRRIGSVEASFAAAHRMERETLIDEGRCEWPDANIDAAVDLPTETNPEELIDLTADREIVEVLLAGLEQRDAFILRQRFGCGGEDPKTLEEIGAMLGLTRERIRQLEKKALDRCRSMMRSVLA